MDELHYFYNGNQLTAVNDAVTHTTDFRDFKDLDNTNIPDENDELTHEYLYDDNGNMIYDENKDISVEYNLLNLPEFVDFGNGNYIKYIYNAAGGKLSKEVYLNDLAYTGDPQYLDTWTDYLGSFIYKDDELEYILSGEGRIIPDQSNYNFEYHLKDHLGNVRVTYTDDNDGDGKADVISENHYYPFGMTMGALNYISGASSSTNKYLYNGKEMQDDLGLDWLDYGARMYDAALGRWHVVDNKAEKYSSISQYVYAINNPILFIDPNGNDVIVYNMGKEKMAAFQQFMQTESGRAYVAQFLKKGESIQGYNYTATTEGKYANSTLRFFAQKNLSAIGRAYVFHKSTDGSFPTDQLFVGTRPVNQEDIGKLQKSGAFEIGIALNSTMIRTVEQWAETLGHEVFVHSVSNAKTVQEVIEAIKKGISYGEILDLITKLQEEAGGAGDDHRLLEQGKDEDYNQYMKEVSNVQNTSSNSTNSSSNPTAQYDAYKKDKEYYEKTGQYSGF